MTERTFTIDEIRAALTGKWEDLGWQWRNAHINHADKLREYEVGLAIKVIEGTTE